MNKFGLDILTRWLPLALILALSLLACRIFEPGPDSPTETAAAETAAAGQSSPPEVEPSATRDPALETAPAGTASPGQGQAETLEPPPAAGRPPQSQAAEIRPPERRQELTRLSALIGFQVLDRNGALLGTAADFVINTCETYVIYFLLEPAGDLGLAPGGRLAVPYEAITINSGALDAPSKSILLHLAPDQLTGAPPFPEAFRPDPTGWEAEVRAYFSQRFRLSNLTTECRVAAPAAEPGGGTVVVHKVALASELSGAGLNDGLQNRLGTVEEAILSPESGKLNFFVVNLQDGQGFVLVPLRVVNIPREALEPGNEISLVLLTENDQLLNAPKFDTLEAAVQEDAQNSARQYWNR